MLFFLSEIPKINMLQSSITVVVEIGDIIVGGTLHAQFATIQTS